MFCPQEDSEGDEVGPYMQLLSVTSGIVQCMHECTYTCMYACAYTFNDHYRYVY